MSTMIYDSLYENVVGVAETLEQANEMIEQFVARELNSSTYWERCQPTRFESREAFLKGEEEALRGNLWAYEFEVGKVEGLITSDV